MAANPTAPMGRACNYLQTDRRNASSLLGGSAPPTAGAPVA